MQELLEEYGVNLVEHRIYEFAPVMLPWWDDESKTSVEIEVIPNGVGSTVLQVLFSDGDEEIAERSPVLMIHFREKEIENETLLAKALYDDFLSTRTSGRWPYEEELQAYLVNDYSKSVNLLQIVLDLIENKTPVHSYSIEMEEDLEYEEGEILDEFITILDMAVRADDSKELNAAYVADMMALAKASEGEEYLEELRADAEAFEGVEDETDPEQAFYAKAVALIQDWFKQH